MFVVDNHSNNSGFTLVELAIVVAVIGVIMGSMVRMILPSVEYMRVTSTQDRLDKVADRLAVFAIKNNRIPCPARPKASAGAEPFGYEIDSGTEGTNPNTTCYGTNTEGIIPFMTLGITQEDAKDGWGRFITYHISPVFAFNPDAVPSSQYDKVHIACRNLNWFSNSRSDNLNPNKARFCCPTIGNGSNNLSPSRDLVIQDESGKPYLESTRTTDADQYEDINERVDSISDIDPIINPAVLENEAVAFVLVSHGKNAYGAFDGKTNSSRFSAISQSGTSETENQDGDKVFVATSINHANNNTHFDDVLTWRTQHQLFNEFGDNSCLNP